MITGVVLVLIGAWLAIFGVTGFRIGQYFLGLAVVCLGAVLFGASFLHIP